MGFCFPKQYNPNNEASLEIFPELISSLEKCLAKVKCLDGGWKEEGRVRVDLPDLNRIQPWQLKQLEGQEEGVGCFQALASGTGFWGEEALFC